MVWVSFSKFQCVGGVRAWQTRAWCAFILCVWEGVLRGYTQLTDYGKICSGEELEVGKESICSHLYDPNNNHIKQERMLASIVLMKRDRVGQLPGARLIMCRPQDGLESHRFHLICAEVLLVR